MKERAADVKDISERVIRILSRKEETVHADDEEKYIIAADDLAPSETIQLERERVLAFVTRQRFYQFSYSHSCQNDEYSGIGISGNSKRSEWKVCNYRWI